MKKINHVVSGKNLHGGYYIIFRGLEEGFILSNSQKRRLTEEICGIEGCTCSQGSGCGPDSRSAEISYDIDQNGNEICRLIPTGGD